MQSLKAVPGLGRAGVRCGAAACWLCTNVLPGPAAAGSGQPGHGLATEPR
jgi:hypothetical protein